MHHFFRLLILLLTVSWANLPLLSQTSINLPKTIIVSKDSQHGLVSFYEVQARNTLYSISKAYKCDIKALKTANPELDLQSIDPGDTLTIPFDSKMIDLYESSSVDHSMIPVYYKTAKKDNLFRIARIYFDQNLELLMKRNKLSNHDLRKDQLILIGWKKGSQNSTPIVQAEESEEAPKTMLPDDEEKEHFVKKINISPEMDSEKRDSIEIVVEEQEILKQNGLAIWNKKSKASGIYALHNDSKTGTLLEIVNPLLNRKVFVKVIGKIPSNSYPENVMVILSTEAARALGALDERFYVKMSFIKE